MPFLFTRRGIWVIISGCLLEETGSSPVVLTMNEKVIENFPCYTVNTAGEVKRLGKVVGRTGKNGYSIINLRYKGARRTCKAHTLVLETFVSKRPEGMECRHLNGNPADNRLDNLCWGTSLENAKDKQVHGTIVRGEDQAGAVLTESRVIEARRRVSAGETSESIAQEWGLPSPMIRAAVNGTKWKHLPGAVKSRPGPKKNYPAVAQKVRALV